MNCSHGGCHDGRNVARYYRPAPNARTSVLCEDCARRVNGLTETWRLDLRTDPERRFKDQSHRVRAFVPAWLGRLRNRDETGALR